MAELAATAAVRLRLTLTGVVQGVGFRPFVYRLASQLGLKGFVLNSSAGLVIEAEGPEALVREFLRRVQAERPVSSLVLTSESVWLPHCGFSSFNIRESERSEDRTAGVLPDLATCPECLREFTTGGERRYGYPFTNCTHCGPRFAIVRDIPYDRANTTLAAFRMCVDCRREYTDPIDRRFHAQPIACPVCGPILDTSVTDAARALAAGLTVALKGIGGFQLLCDARNETTVVRLRSRKHRDAKPFAMMMPDLQTVRRYCRVSEEEERALTSSAAPIVLLEPKDCTDIAPSVSDASPWFGVMLPYSPLHHLLLRAFPWPVVATSGNVSGEPIAVGNDEAKSRLGAMADCFVMHDRPIARPCDDSVVRVRRGRQTVIRRARGYAPLPVRVSYDLPRVLAVGGHLRNTVAIAIGRNVYLSQHIGDLDTLESRRAFENAIDDLCRLYRFQPEAVVCDAHPDYASSDWARSSGLPVIEVQHHLAHAAACAADNDLTGSYLAAVWDGSGYGLDGAIWGGEFFAVTQNRFERVAHLRPFRLPGGEAAIRQGWRVAESLRAELGLSARFPLIRRMLECGLNCPSTTSMGRLFDAVAALTGIAEESRYEGEAAMRLERAARGEGAYRLSEGDWRPLIEQVLGEQDPALAAARFHRALAGWIVEVAQQAGMQSVVLSGGCFQNVLLTELACDSLQSSGFHPYVHQQVPPNDGGISLGQAIVAGTACRVTPPQS